MAQYIDKSALVAEIERKLKNINLNYVSVGSHPSDSDTNKKLQDGISKNLQDLLSFIKTLEVKENDLVEELDYDDYMSFFKVYPEYDNVDWGFEETWTFGQYCYKLGIKARKGG